jgi:hypothetical protein
MAKRKHAIVKRSKTAVAEKSTMPFMDDRLFADCEEMTKTANAVAAVAATDDDEIRTSPPISSHEAWCLGGDNAQKYIAPVKPEIPCEDEYYFWADSEYGKVYKAAPYNLVCDFTAQAVKRYIKQRPQEFLAELTSTMQYQEPFSMQEFCLEIALTTLAEFMYVPGKKLEEANRNCVE